ncbi:hypothetical protein B0T20DRAFT_64843 [Sordaria brevicollis]|uniref:Uncharacterized protein n=1 Tax=Sordaria brevicollis TaxID=83679 RepID=A0AAE0U5H6_SORBR|nr:hypothetical protein B0T20DRAFT_64843 [Sordaria brevicollis]
MAKASDFGSEDCAFESRVGRFIFFCFCTFLHPTTAQAAVGRVHELGIFFDILLETTPLALNTDNMLVQPPTWKTTCLFSLSSHFASSVMNGAQFHLAEVLPEVKTLLGRQVGDEMRTPSFFKS